MSLSSPIAVLGAGSWGTALALLLTQNGQQVRLWGHNPSHMQEIAATRYNQPYLPGVLLPEELQLTADLASALNGVEDVLIVVPSKVFRGLISTIKPFVTQNTR